MPNDKFHVDLVLCLMTKEEEKKEGILSILEREEEGRHTWIVGPEAHDDITVWPHHKGISSHRHLYKVALREILIGKGTGLFLRAMDGLECVTVKMDGMTARVEVVDDDLDNFALLQDKGAGELSVDGGVVREIACGESCVESGHFGLSVGDVVEEGVVLSITEIVHDDVQLHDLVWLRQQLHLVIWYEIHVVKGVEFVDDGSCREVGFGVICQPSSGVVVEILRQGIKQSLYEG
jgi:hypothetical protein